MEGRHEGSSDIAGRSANREANRRRERLLQQRKARSRLARVVLGPSAQEKRLAEEEKHWATGARGEELLATMLAKRCPEAVFLHDRRIPRSRANLDHIAITHSGIYVIDAKRYRGKIEVRSRLFGESKLVIAGRDRTKLVAGLERQVNVVRQELASFTPELPVHGCLCFVAPEGLLADIGLPIVRTLKISGFPLLYPRRLARYLNRSGPLTSEQMQRICALLAERLPPA